MPVEPSSPPAWRVWLRRLGPWVVTAGILAFLLHRYSLSEIRERMAEGDTAAMIPFALAAGLSSLLLIASADALVFRAGLGGARWWSVVKGKAATSVLQTLGYGFGHGGYGIWLARTTGAGVGATVGMIGYVMVSDLAALSLVAGVAVAFGGDFLGPDRQLAFAAIAWGLAAALILAALVGPRLLRRLGVDRPIVRPWRAVSARVFAGSIALRAGNLTVAVLATYAAARVFGVPVPLGAVVVYLPIIFLIGALPVNVAGFGAVQAAWVVFFEPWAPGAQLLAFQFLWHLMVMFLLLARGAPFLRGVLREIEVGRNIQAKVKSSASAGSASEPAEGGARGSTAR